MATGPLFYRTLQVTALEAQARQLVPSSPACFPSLAHHLRQAPGNLQSLLHLSCQSAVTPLFAEDIFFAGAHRSPWPQTGEMT